MTGGDGVRPAAAGAACLLLWMLTSSGCGEQPVASSSGGTLRVALQADGKTLDPHLAVDAASMRLIENMYDTLMRYSADYPEVEPGLAERVEVSDDGVSYTFHLIPGAGARFHDGSPVTSEAVRFSLERIRDMGVRSQALEPVAAIDTPDERTVVLTLSEPSAALLSHLAHPMNAIVNPAVVAASGGRLDRADAGSGPFKLEEWRKDQHLVLVRHNDYHVADRPRLARIVFQVHSDETARTIALRTGEIDLILDVPAKDAPVLEQAPNVTVESSPGTFFEYIGLNTQRPPLDDARVRQAIACAVDRRRLNEIVKFGRAEVLDGGHIPRHHWAHLDEAVYPRRDITRAKQLLMAAGLPDGFSATLKVGADFPYQVQAAELVKQQLRDVGIKLRIQTLESGVFFDDLAAGNFDLTLVGWVGFVDPDEWMWNLFHSRGKYNQQQYRSDEVDRLLDDARVIHDRERRRELYAEAQRIVARDAPMVFLYVNPQVSAFLAAERRVRGFRPHPTATTIGLRDAWVTER